MNNRLRNPFRLRASEKIESDASFLRLYSPIVLEALSEKHEKGKLWNTVLYIHSSPGAGKTSLLRVFDPNALTTLFNSKSSSDYKELFTALKKLDAVSDHSIEVLGVPLTCTRNYEALEDLPLQPHQRIRYFFSLLNVRIVLATLRAILSYKQLSFPEGLRSIQFSYDNREGYFKSIQVPCNGQELFNWASDIEKKIYSAIDSFMPTADNELEGHSELFSLFTLTSDSLSVDGTAVPGKILFMLDDTHKLSTAQRESLKKYIIEKRGSFHIWIAERNEALEPIDNLRSVTERDYEEIDLERFWAQRESKFEKVLRNIAAKRASISSEDVNSFAEYLDTDLEEEFHKASLRLAEEKVTASLSEIASLTSKYDQWIEYVNTHKGSQLERANLAKKVEILISRNRGKTQIAFDFPLTVEELEDKLGPELDAPTKLFVAKEGNIPYYFGFSTLVRLSTNNIDQFLSFAGDLFEEMISNKISGKNVMLKPQVQEKIYKRVADRKWKELTKVIPYPNEVKNFLTELLRFSSKETYKPNAPYGAGINGFSVKPGNSLNIHGVVDWTLDPAYEPLVNVISTCISFNLLEPRTTKQGEKDQEWTVYYLNRWLCVRNQLSLSYGNFRHKTPDELIKWIKK